MAVNPTKNRFKLFTRLFVEAEKRIQRKYIYHCPAKSFTFADGKVGFRALAIWQPEERKGEQHFC